LKSAVLAPPSRSQDPFLFTGEQVNCVEGREVVEDRFEPGLLGEALFCVLV
jgi:hypothetical protein